MGWLYRNACFFDKHGKVNRKAECNSRFDSSRCEVLKSMMVGTVYYAAVRSKADGHVFGSVFLTSARDGSFGYKAMDETVGPCERRCPDSILDLLSPTDDEWSNEWRKDCRAYNAQKRAERRKL